MSRTGSTAPRTCHEQSILLGAAGVLGGVWPQFGVPAASGGSSCALRSPSCTVSEIVARQRLRFGWWSLALARSPFESSVPARWIRRG